VIFLRYWKPIVGVLLLLACVTAGWGLRGKVCEAKADKLAADQAKAYQAAVEHWQKIAYDTDEKLQAALKAQPKTGQTVREVIRNAPSTCTVAPAAVERLRAGVKAANTSTSSG
jgi:outer membrane murein-binding lipoprotein Lpp